MKTFFAFLLIFVSVMTVNAQTNSVAGAWTMSDGESRHHLFFQDGFFFHTVQQGNQFVMSRGGTYETKAGNISAKTLYNSADANDVGQSMTVPFSMSGSALTVNVPNGEARFERVDNGTAPLAGVWRITGRMGEDGKVADIHQTGSRQTYKMLTGTKFQWVAIDPDKKQFSGTGGGSYTFKDGKYTENIEFFSRDNSRVGASLVFDGKLENGKWHHSGLSSKGAKIYEVWSKVK